MRIGDSTIGLTKYGTGDVRLTSSLRTDGIVRGLGGLYAGAFTTAERDALTVDQRPFGVIILNKTANRLQQNFGTVTNPDWRSFGGLFVETTDIRPSTTDGDFLRTIAGAVVWAPGDASVGGSSVPTGAILPFLGLTAPSGYVIGVGQLVSTSNPLYADLFNEIGYTYGGSGGSFIIPDLRGRFMVFVGTHVDVNAAGKNEGESDPNNRRPKHKHTVPTATVSGNPKVTVNYQLGTATDGATTEIVHHLTDGASDGSNQYNVSGFGTLNVKVGPQTASPTDSGAYFVCNGIIKL